MQTSRFSGTRLSNCVSNFPRLTKSKGHYVHSSDHENGESCIKSAAALPPLRGIGPSQGARENFSGSPSALYVNSFRIRSVISTGGTKKSAVNKARLPGEPAASLSREND